MMTLRISFTYLAVFAAFASAGCKSPNARQSGSEVLGSVVREDSMVSEWVFHYGPKKLLRDINIQGYQDNWSKLVDNSQIPMRSGLYVNQHPAYGERYALSAISESESESPWLVALKIKSICRTEKDVVKELPEEMMKNAAFRDWIKSPLADSSSYDNEADFTAACLKPEAFKPFDKSQGNPTKCANTLTNFFSKPNHHLGAELAGGDGIQIVKDSLYPKEGYWYLRSPRCIEQVRSGVKDIFAMAGEIPDFWAKSPFTDNYERQVMSSSLSFSSGDAQLYILLRAIAEADALDNFQLLKIRQNAAKSDLPGLGNLVSKIIEKAQKCTELPVFQKELQDYLNFAQKPSNLLPTAGGIEFIVFKQALERQMAADCGSENKIEELRAEERARKAKEEQARIEAEKQRQARLAREQKEQALQREKNAYKCPSGTRGPYYKYSNPDTGDCGGNQGTTQQFSDGSYGYCCYGSTSSSSSSSGRRTRGCGGYQGRGYNASDCHSRYPGCFTPCTMVWDGYRGQSGTCTCELD